MWPLHTWLPDAHTEAPTVGSVLLAGVLLKMGTYGFVRIALPGAARRRPQTFAPWLGAFAVVGIVYGVAGLPRAARPQAADRLLLVGHMGFVLLGIATLTPVGINGALFGNIAHGLITGLLFFLVGGDQGPLRHTATCAALGGGMLRQGAAPRLGLLAFAAVASLGLPGLAGFWGEMLAMLGAFQPAAGLHRGPFLVLHGGRRPRHGAHRRLPSAAAAPGHARPDRRALARRAHSATCTPSSWPPGRRWSCWCWRSACGREPLLGVTDAAVRQLLGGG